MCGDGKRNLIDDSFQQRTTWNIAHKCEFIHLQVSYTEFKKVYCILILSLFLNLIIYSAPKQMTLTRRRKTKIDDSYHRTPWNSFGIIVLLVNPLAATPLFSPSSLARAALFGLVRFSCRGIGESHQPKIRRKAPVRQCTIGTSPLSIR